MIRARTYVWGRARIALFVSIRPMHAAMETVMRVSLAFALIAVGSVGLLRAGEKELLDKFKQQNNSSRDKIEADIKQTLEQAKEIEKEDPAGALGMLQEVRD